jgi:ABC-type nitrate/sulfonate/bicarbonate transport system substrate-binding protein
MTAFCAAPSSRHHRVPPLRRLRQDKIKVGVFPSSSALPFYVALERGYFKEVGIEPEAVVFNATR